MEKIWCKFGNRVVINYLLDVYSYHSLNRNLHLRLPVLRKHQFFSKDPETLLGLIVKTQTNQCARNKTINTTPSSLHYSSFTKMFHHAVVSVSPQRLCVGAKTGGHHTVPNQEEVKPGADITVDHQIKLLPNTLMTIY